MDRVELCTEWLYAIIPVMDMDSVMDPTVCIIVFVLCSNVFTDSWDNVDTFTTIIIYASCDSCSCYKKHWFILLKRIDLSCLCCEPLAISEQLMSQSTHPPRVTKSHYTPYSHMVNYRVSFLFILSRRGFLQSTGRPHQRTARPLERATSHIKGTLPPCLFRLLPWENINRSTKSW